MEKLPDAVLEVLETLEQAGGAAYIADLAQSHVSAANAEYYAKLVRDKSIQRGLIEAGAKIVSTGFDTSKDLAGLIDEAEQSVMAVSSRTSSGGFRPVQALVGDVVDAVLKPAEGGITGLATGYPELDAITRGLQPSDLIIIAARPAMGKTALALNLAMRAAISEGAPVGIFSLEMSEHQLVQRMISLWGKIPQEQQQQLAAALEQQMASDAVQALIQQQTDAQMQSQEAVQAVAQNVEAQVQALVEQQMQSDAVQAQVQAAEAQYQSALESLTALRAQLESFQAFHDGLAAYTQGAASAAAGAAQINEAMPALTQGVSQLRSGAMQLKTGLTVLNASGIQRITGLAGDDLDDLVARVRAIVAAAQDYQSFSGVAPSAQGAVRFIWRTDAIEAK